MAETGKMIGEIDEALTRAGMLRTEYASIHVNQLREWLNTIVTAAAELDPDCQPITDFSKMKRVKSMRKPMNLLELLDLITISASCQRETKDQPELGLLAEIDFLIAIRDYCDQESENIAMMLETKQS